MHAGARQCLTQDEEERQTSTITMWDGISSFEMRIQEKEKAMERWDVLHNCSRLVSKIPKVDARKIKAVVIKHRS